MNLSQPYLRRGPRTNLSQAQTSPRATHERKLFSLDLGRHCPPPDFSRLRPFHSCCCASARAVSKTWLLSAPHGDNSATLSFRHRPVLLARPSNFRIRRPRFDQYLSQRLVRLHGRVSACKGCRSEACAGCFTSGSRHVVFVRAKFGGVFDRDAGGIRALVITCAF